MSGKVSDAHEFDARAVDYGASRWHFDYAEALVAAARLTTGSTVLDAATGTGYAAFAAARAVGTSGHVIGVDLSAPMINQAQDRQRELRIGNVEFVQGDACSLDGFEDGSLDAVLCSAGLLYLEAPVALATWRRVLRPGGIVAFSSMRAGSPPASAIFRAVCAEIGLRIVDPSLPLGSPEDCLAVLAGAGFADAAIVESTVVFPETDLDRAWRAHSLSPGCRPLIDALPDADRENLQRRYSDAISAALRDDARRLLTAQVLYATARRPHA